MTRFLSRLVIQCLLLSYANFSYGSTQQRVYKNTPFQYHLKFADVQCWIDRICQGRIPAEPRGELSKEVLRLTQSAKEKIQLAIYGIRNQNWLVDVLKQKNNKRVAIYSIFDQARGELGDWHNPANFTYSGMSHFIKTLGSRNVRVDVNVDGTPRTSTIMHNKYFVIDEKAVWLGSANLSETGVGNEYNANLTLSVHDKDIAKLYVDEFEQMHKHLRFSRKKISRSRIEEFVYSDGSEVSVYFSPQDSPIEKAIIPSIQAARKTIFIGMFFLTSKLIGEELIKAKNRGVEVRAIIDATSARHSSSIIDKLRENYIPVKVENWGGKMHLKTAVIDEQTTILGSMNWSNAGNNNNDENTMLIKKNSRLAGEVSHYLQTLWDQIPDLPFRTNTFIFDPRPESHDSINSCEDGLDNDYFGGVDEESIFCR